MLRDLTVRGFFDGVTVSGNNDKLFNVILERQCDESVSSTGTGTQIVGGTISKGCDKCTQDYAGDTIASTCQENMCYHTTYDGVSFQGCAKPLRAAGSDADGIVMHIKNISVTPLSGFACSGSELTSLGIETLIEGGSVSNCDSGWILGGPEGLHTVTGGHYVTGSPDRGILAQGNPQTGNGATVILRGAVVQGNGGGNGAAPRGGVTVKDKGSLDLGITSSDRGNNKICRNTTSGTTERDVHINRDNLTVFAEYNYWRANGGPPAVTIKTPAAQQTASTISYTNRYADAADPVDAVGIACQ